MSHYHDWNDYREQSDREFRDRAMEREDARQMDDVIFDGEEPELDRATRRAPRLPELPAGFKFISLPGKKVA